MPRYSDIQKVIFIFLIINFINNCTEDTNPVITESKEKAKLVFAMKDSTIGPGGIYTMNLDGSDLTPVAVMGDSVYFPGYWGNYYVLNAYSVLNYPRWSPDGKKIACQLSWAYEGYVIMIMNADGTNKHVLWKVRAAAKRPQWSPEGDKILFMRSGYLGAIFATGIVDSSGENDRDFQISGDTDPYIFNSDSLWFMGDIQWGPTNNLIYLLASINKKPISYPDGTNNIKELNLEIFSVNLNTGEVIERITNNTFQESLFRLSPDGEKIIFPGEYLSRPLNLLYLAKDIFIKISTGGRIDFFFNWSSDSKTIVYAKDENPDKYYERLYLYMINIETPDEQIKLTNFEAVEPDLFIPNN